MRILSSLGWWRSSIYAALSVLPGINQWIDASDFFLVSPILVRFNNPSFTLFIYQESRGCSWFSTGFVFSPYFFLLNVCFVGFCTLNCKRCVWLCWISFWKIYGVILFISWISNLNFRSEVFFVLEVGLVGDPSGLCRCSLLIWWGFDRKD